MNAMERFLFAQKVRKGRTLIVGSKVHEGTGKADRRKLFNDALGVDMEEGLGVDRVLDLEETLPSDLGKFKHVECTSVLEHSRRPWLMCANIEQLMIEAATIVVMVPWVWRIHGYPSDYFRYTPAAIESLLPSINWQAKSYIVEDALVPKVQTMTDTRGVRYLARSELIMFGYKRQEKANGIC